MSAVHGFTPSSRGFRFANSWPNVPAFDITVLDRAVPVGNAANGLCGGMVFAVRDYFEAGSTVPTDISAPDAGPLYEFVGRRLKDSFDLPLGPAKYLDYMAAPDRDTGIPFLRWLIGPRIRGVAWRTIRDELPKIIADLDMGRLCCLGLVCSRGLDPNHLGRNHQVLAYGYEMAADDVRISVYDPNRPLRDDISLQLSIARPNKATPINFVNGSKDVRGFFRVAYVPAKPPTPP